MSVNLKYDPSKFCVFQKPAIKSLFHLVAQVHHAPSVINKHRESSNALRAVVVCGLANAGGYNKV